MNNVEMSSTSSSKRMPRCVLLAETSMCGDSALGRVKRIMDHIQKDFELK